MKTKEKIMPILMLAMVLGLVGCGNSVPAINNSVVVDTEESTKAEEKVIPDGEVPATAKPTEEETNPTANPVNDEPTATPEPETEPTEPPHVHNYEENVTKQATCAETGEKTLTCSCGNIKTEAIPATGNHNWEEITNVVHHEELGHVEQVQVGTTEGKTEYACAVCGARFGTPSGVVDHCANFVGTDRSHATARTLAYDYPGEPIFEPQWVVDQNAWEETVVTGYTCSICGATK